MTKLDVSEYEGKRLAVLLGRGDAARWVYGEASLARDPNLGRVLKIALEPATWDGGATVLISEADWRGRIEASDDGTCDYCFVPRSVAPVLE